MRLMCWMVTFVMALISIPAASQQVPSVDEIVHKLRPPSPVRGLTLRGVTVEGAVEQPAAGIDLSVNFEFASARLTTDALVTLDNLGQALNHPALQAYRFMIAGHTDARGSADYNQKLSEERAQAVTDYLIRIHHLDPKRLTAKGFGFTDLLYKSDPTNALNRRVRVTAFEPGS